MLVAVTRALGVALLSLVVLAPWETRADGRPVTLTYVVEAGAERCPDERWVRQAVAARLGFDPFRPDGDTRIEARIRRTEQGLAASLEVTTREGQRIGRRHFTSPTGDCLELASAMELAMAIAVDPRYLSRPAAPPPPPPPAPEPHLVEPTKNAAPPLVPPRPGAPVQVRAGAGVLAAAGVSPAVVPSVLIQVSMRWPRFSIGLDGRADIASNFSVGSGQVSSSALLGTVVPCLHVGRFGACGLLSMGAIQVTGEIGQQRRETSPLVLAGGRVQAELPLSTSLYIQPFLDFQAVLTRTTILSGEQPVWVTSPVAGAAGLTLSLRFL